MEHQANREGGDGAPSWHAAAQRCGDGSGPPHDARASTQPDVGGSRGGGSVVCVDVIGLSGDVIVVSSGRDTGLQRRACGDWGRKCGAQLMYPVAI